SPSSSSDFRNNLSNFRGWANANLPASTLGESGMANYIGHFEIFASDGGGARRFQKLLEYRDIMGADPLGAVARVHLARAFALSGDTTSLLKPGCARNRLFDCHGNRHLFRKRHP